MMPAVHERIANQVFDLATGAEDTKRKTGPDANKLTKRVRLMSGPPNRGGGAGTLKEDALGAMHMADWEAGRVRSTVSASSQY